jgi:hypothetical protein
MGTGPVVGQHGRKRLFSVTLATALLLLAACGGPAPTEVVHPPTPTLVPASPTPLASPTPSSFVVTSPADAGPGTVRQALEDAEGPAVVTFDPSVFPPDAPVTIRLASSLPGLDRGNLVIDASNAGVILDGSNITSPDPQSGIAITSDNNIVRGLQIVGFSEAGIALHGGAQYNMIGGDRTIGAAPLGQGNLISGNGKIGVGLWDEDTSHNTIQGNYIGINLDATETWGHAGDGLHSNGATQNLITDNVIGGGQSAGVYLCCVLDGRNTVTDNLIGVGPSGTTALGNRNGGVIIDRTSHNVIGPGNIIAYNQDAGILFWEDAPNNTITQNSIRDNLGRGIGFASTNPTPLQPPLVFNFDLQAGALDGTACPNCTVEIFSDSSDEGATFEGYAKAEDDGVFIFTKDAPLAGPSLTATATDPAGSTSAFSPPTEGAGRSLTLQSGEHLGMSRLETRLSGELADNRIGGNAETQHVGAGVWNTGLKWMRVIVDAYGQWQHADWDKDEYAIDPDEESVIDNLVSHGVRIMLVLDVWHPESRVVFYKTEKDIALYESWVRFMVHHFKGRVEYYEILNEPDLNFEAPSGMPVAAYVNLVKQTVPVIRGEDPQAKIVVGAVPDTRFDGVRDWMWGLLNSEVMPLVDGFSWHGMYGAAPSDDPRGVRQAGSPQLANYWEHYPDLVKEIMSVAASNGFKGEYLVEEMLWRTPSSPHESEPYGFTDVSGAKYYARAIVIHLGLNVAPGLAVVPEDERPLSHSVIRSLSTIMAGAQPTDLPVVIESEASNTRYYGFTLADGVKLLAVWTDSAAVDYDPGASATLTFPGLYARRAVGIDPLQGFEQELIIERLNADLVIPDMRIKDYPVIVRLEP